MPGSVTLFRLLQAEVTQRQEEGCALDPGEWRERLQAIGPDDRPALEAAYDELMSLAPAPGFPFDEPSDLDSIRAAHPREGAPSPEPAVKDLPRSEMFDRIHGGWLGRCCGCSLGKPFEKAPYFTNPERRQRQAIQQWLEGARAWPLSFYIPDHSLAERIGLDVWRLGCTEDAIRCMEIDDDINYMLIALRMFEECVREGRSPSDFHTCDVALAWLNLLTFAQASDTQVFLNLAHDERFVHWGRSREEMEAIDWADIACRRNPYREQICAQIRADVYGYVAAGDPERAAEYAWRDARMSHVKNGIYGAMFVAAMIAAAFSEKEPRRVIEIGLAQIPAQSRLAAAIRMILKIADKREQWQGCWDEMMERFGDYEPVHTIPNALVCVIGLLYGAGDFEKSICTAVSCGLDTDCNGATVGSILGVMNGAQRLPKKWTTPLNNTIKSGVLHYSQTTITECAQRTAKIVDIIRAERLTRDARRRTRDAGPAGGSEQRKSQTRE